MSPYLKRHQHLTPDTIGLTGEFRHQTATTTFLATPNRGRVVLAKLATYALVGIAYALVCIAVTIAIAVPWLNAKGIQVPLGGNGIPEQVGFATKPALATQMLVRALDAGVPTAWVTGDEVYGADPGLRAELERRGIGYVLAVACDHPVLAAGDRYRADALLRRVPARAWQWVSAGRGAKGHRLYDWALSAWTTATPILAASTGCWRAATAPPGELAFYRCWTPRPVLLATLVRVAGRRWTIEERFQTGKGLVGLDQHQVRRWRSWYRWTTLAMLAHAFLVVAALTDRTRHPPPSGLISLTCNEVQHLFAALLTRPAGDLGHRLRWSLWRRRHQARARTCHYRRQAARP